MHFKVSGRDHGSKVASNHEQSMSSPLFERGNFKDTDKLHAPHMPSLRHSPQPPTSYLSARCIIRNQSHIIAQLISTLHIHDPHTRTGVTDVVSW